MITLAALKGGAFSGFWSWPSPCLHNLGRPDSREQGRGKGKIIPSWEVCVWTTHQTSQGCGHFSKWTGERSTESEPSTRTSPLLCCFIPYLFTLKSSPYFYNLAHFSYELLQRDATLAWWYRRSLLWAGTDSFCSQSPIAGSVVESETGRCKRRVSLEPGRLFLSWEVSVFEWIMLWI